MKWGRGSSHSRWVYKVAVGQPRCGMPTEHTTGVPLQKWVLVGAIYSSSVAPLLVNTVPQVNQILDQSMHIGATALGFFSSADAGGIAAGALIAALTSRFSSPRLTIFAG